MKIQVYSIFDRVASAYNTPFYFQNDLLAVRTFNNLKEDPKTTVGKNPDDFSLHHIGEFDDEEGVITDAEARGEILNGKGKTNG